MSRQEAEEGKILKELTQARINGDEQGLAAAYVQLGHLHKKASQLERVGAACQHAQILSRKSANAQLEADAYVTSPAAAVKHVLRSGGVVAFLVLSLLHPSSLSAVTWDFAQGGDTQGWVAWESEASGAVIRIPLHSETAGGVWRVFPRDLAPGIRPIVELISPPIGRDSALFNRVHVRLRVLHTRPLESQITLLWKNLINKSLPKFSIKAQPGTGIDHITLFKSQRHIYTADWQEMTIDSLVSKIYVREDKVYRRTWENELLEIRIRLTLFNYLKDLKVPEEIPKAVEIDWIELTHAEGPALEVAPLRGEEPHPVGTLFALPLFYPLDIHGLSIGQRGIPVAELGDLDGDGDMDMAAVWEDWQPSTNSGRAGRAGWLCAFNEGGSFSSEVSMERFPAIGPIPRLIGANLFGDDRMELIVSSGYSLDLLERSSAGWSVARHIADRVIPLGIGDVDGDGDEDIWLTELYSKNSARAVILLNDGEGQFDEQMALAPELGEFAWLPMRLIYHVPGGRKTGLLWKGPDVGTPHDYMATYLDENGETIQEYLRVDAAADLICYAGDFDQDGDTDMVAGRAVASMTPMGPVLTGLDLLINPGDGILDKVAWYERSYVQQDVVFSDLNEDGLLDAVFVDRNFRQPALVVSTGRKNGVPLREGHYPLQGLGGMVMGRDVDGDSDIDLVVLENAVRGGGSGIYILSNQTQTDD